MNTTSETRELPNIKLSKRVRQDFADFTARIESEGLHVGQTVSVKRVTTDSRDYVLTQWWEPAVILELRNFDALVQFQDGTRSSSGLGMKTL